MKYVSVSVEGCRCEAALDTPPPASTPPPVKDEPRPHLSICLAILLLALRNRTDGGERSSTFSLPPCQNIKGAL